MSVLKANIRRFIAMGIAACCFWAANGPAATWAASPSSPMTDTGQIICYSNSGPMTCPAPGRDFFGQDANYAAAPMAYKDNGDGTITDLVTGLMWARAVNAEKSSLTGAEKEARTLTLGGYSDWRVPTVKELYSLINFSGNTGVARPGSSGRVPGAVPYINTDYFNFKYGNTRAGERYIDAQWLSSTRYVSYTMERNFTLFGVNFADGRIKGYGYGNSGMRKEKKFYVRFVRGNAYGQNQFRSNGNGTVMDLATGLTWMQADSGRAMSWEAALAYAEDATHGGHTDWRLPNAKELQFIVDYSRSPDTTDSAAIDPLFSATSITNEAGQKDYAHYWTSTSHLDGRRPGDSAVTVCFGRALGKMHGRIMDVHGAGAQRSDPKTGSNAIGHGPQGDARRSKNMVRLVRGGDVTIVTRPRSSDRSRYPFVVNVDKGYEAMASGNSSGQGLSRPGSNRPGSRERFGNSSQGGRSLGRTPGGQGFVKRLDRNGDNRVSKTEFDGPPSHFSRFDRNRDGYITEDEAPTGPPPGKRQP